MCNCSRVPTVRKFVQAKNKILKLWETSRLEEKEITVIKINKK